MAQSHIVGYPRIGRRRELKRATERYWDGRITREELEAAGRQLRLEAWTLMRDAGIDFIPSNTFTFYDQVLDTTCMVGAAPPRYGVTDGPIDLDTYFAMARGAQRDGLDVTAMEMTKWFDTNYHYLVPEFRTGQTFRLASAKAVDEYNEARAAGIETVPVLVGPLTYLLSGKGVREDGAIDPGFDALSLLPALLPVYVQVVSALRDAGAQWVQLDEPALVQDRTPRELDALREAYTALAEVAGNTQLLVQTYFGNLDESYAVLASLPVGGIGIDLVRGLRNPGLVEQHGLPEGMLLFAGVVDGRNIWLNDMETSLAKVGALRQRLASEPGDDRVVVSTSASLQHVPVDLSLETELDDELQSWLAFANQKVAEVATIARALGNRAAAADELARNAAALASRRDAARTRNPQVRERLAAVQPGDYRRRGSVETRRAAQRARLNLPPFPTTTIGSFPQTPDIRRARKQLTDGEIAAADYERAMEQEIERVVRMQEEIGLDVLVHGEAERNDMVEYFGEQLEGFTFTRFGWVQSYGTRNTKPPIIFGDVSRPGPMTVRWARYAQSLSSKPVKGMLTGPVTILQWSFVRDDQPRADTCKQIALAIRDEVVDLEAAGIGVIQVDEPALREGLPLRHSDWADYLEWSVGAFRLSAAGVRDETQIQTHMCYAEFNDIIQAISDMDADVMLIENSRSSAELLRVFRDFKYDKEIGPGVYDIHSPRVPPAEEMAQRLREATEVLANDLVWVNPDCGLKTRRYEEVVPALEHMVQAAAALRGASVPR